MCKTWLDLKIHPRPSRGCKVPVKAGSHHRPSCGSRIRGNPKTRKRHNRKMREPGKLGDASTAKPKERRIGATRGSATGDAERGEDSGQPEDSTPGKLEGAKSGATRRLTLGRAGRSRNRGDPKPDREARLEERRFGATRRFTLRYRRRT